MKPKTYSIGCIEVLVRERQGGGYSIVVRDGATEVRFPDSPVLDVANTRAAWLASIIEAGVNRAKEGKES